MEAAIARAGLGEAIRIHRVDPDGLPRLAASGDIVVSIADTDSSPSSLLEAMASGNPLVGGWCASIDEWIGPARAPRWCSRATRTRWPRHSTGCCRTPALRERYAQRNLRVVRERVAESAPALEALYPPADRRACGVLAGRRIVDCSA